MTTMAMTGDFTIVAGRAATHVENCPKCCGSGRWHGYHYSGQCFKCNGTGKLAFKSSKAERVVARQRREEKKVAMAKDAWETFATTNPAEAAWLESRPDSFSFAASVREAIKKYGDLTERQMIAVRNCMAKDADREVQKAQAVAARPVVDVSRMAEALNKAHDAGLKRPFVLTESFKFSRAPDTGKNPGAIYVTAGDQYLGKIANNSLIASRECTAEKQIEILAVCADPLAAAVAYGKKTGVCSCCARELTDPVSIAKGIGPICEKKYF